MAESPSRRQFYVAALGIFAIALGLRLAYLVHLVKLPFFGHPIMDASYHDTWARDILSGHTAKYEPFFRGPLYPYCLALVYLATKGSYVAPRLVQFVLGSLTSVVTLWLAGRYFGRRAGIIAGLACAVYPVLVYFDGELLTESLFIFLSMLGLAALEIARQRQSKPLWFLSGLAFGLALITRPNIALFLPVAVVGAAVFSRRRLAASLMLLAGLLVPLAPVTTRNIVATGEFIPLVWQSGINFYLGNNASSTGWSATSPDIRKDWWGGYKDMIAVPRAALGREPSFNEVSAYWTRKGLGFVRTHPREWLGLMVKKTALFWNSMEFPNNQDFNFMKLYSWVLRNPVITFGTVAPLALVALFAFRRRARELYFLYGLFLTTFLGTIAYFVCDRYRLPALPPMLIFAAGLASCLIDLAAARKFMRLGIYLACLAVAAFVVNVNPTGERLPDFAQSYAGLGKTYASMGKNDEAVAALNKAIQVNPRWGEAYEQLGLLKMQAGENKDAEAFFLKAVQVWPDFATPYRALAMIYLSEDRVGEARVAIDTALRLAPFLEDAHNVLGSVETRQGMTDEALSSFKQEIELDPGNWRAHANLGTLYEKSGETDAALKAYETSLEINPKNPDVLLALASLHARRGEADTARALLDRLGSEPVGDLNLRYNQAAILQQNGKLEEAGKIYEGILSQDPRHEGSLVNLGVIYAKLGRTTDAASLWQRALAVNPSNETARRNLGLLNKRQAAPPRN